MLNVGDTVLINDPGAIYHGSILEVTEVLPDRIICTDGGQNLRAFKPHTVNGDPKSVINELQDRLKKWRKLAHDMAYALPLKHPLRMKAVQLELGVEADNAAERGA